MREQNGEAKTFAKDTTSFRTASSLNSCYSKWLQLTFTNLFFVILCFCINLSSFTEFLSSVLCLVSLVHVQIIKIQGNLGKEKPAMMTFFLTSTFIQV